MFPGGCLPLDARGSARFRRRFGFFCHGPKEAKKKHGKKGEAWAEHTPPGARLLISACHMCKAQVQVTLLSLRWAPRPTPTRVPGMLAGPRPGEEEPSMNAQRA